MLFQHITWSCMIMAVVCWYHNLVPAHFPSAWPLQLRSKCPYNRAPRVNTPSPPLSAVGVLHYAITSQQSQVVQTEKGARHHSAV